MNILKRIILSVFGNKIKSLLILSVFLFSSLFIGVANTIHESIIDVERNIKENLNAKAVMVYNDYVNDFSDYKEVSYNQEQEKIFEFYNNLKKTNYINKSNINYVSEMIGIMKANLSYPGYNEFSNSGQEGLKIGFFGVNNQEILIEENVVGIVEGRFLNQEEIDNNESVAVIDYQFTYEDGSPIKIGDKITLFHFDDNTNKINDIEVSVIGKYENKAPNFEIWDNKYGPYMCFIMPNSLLKTTVEKINKDTDAKPRMMYLNMLFYVKNVDDFDEITDFYNQYFGNDEKYSFLTSADYYLQIKSSLDNIDMISIVILVISIVCSVVIIVLSISFYVKGKEKEIGIMLSLGEKFENVKTQYICEMFILGMLGIFISFPLTSIISEYIWKIIVSNNFNEVISTINYSLNYYCLVMIIILGGCLIFVSVSFFLKKLIERNLKEILL